MSSQQIMEELVRRVTLLENQLKRIEILKPNFEISNTEDVTLGADQTAWDIPNVDVINLSASVATVNIHGIANGLDGRVLHVVNIGNTVVLKHFSFSAGISDRIASPTGADISLTAGKAALLIYLYDYGFWNSYFWRAFYVSP